MENEPLFSCVNISKSYGGAPILEDISLGIPAAGFVSLVGPSGVGKTTLFNILAGTEQADTGSVRLNGADITGCAGKVSYMPQKDLLFEHLTVLDNITLPLLIQNRTDKNAAGIRRISKKEAREYALSFFERFGLDGYERNYPAQLSGGMRQRAALLRACMVRNTPTSTSGNRVILLDEPFSALDALTRTHIHSWYEEIACTMRLSTLCITHDIEEAVKLSQYVYIMAGRPARLRGRIAVDAPLPRSNDFLLSSLCARLKQDVSNLLRNH